MLQQPVGLSDAAPLVTWVGLAAFIVLCLVMGWLIPWRIHREVVKDRDVWRQAALDEAEARRDSEQQVHKLLEVADMTYALVLAIQKATGVQPEASPIALQMRVEGEG